MIRDAKDGEEVVLVPVQVFDSGAGIGSNFLMEDFLETIYGARTRECPVLAEGEGRDEIEVER